jgi:HK97 family phage prohead protease
MERTGYLIKYDQLNSHKQMVSAGACNEWLAGNVQVPILFEHREHLRAGHTVRFEESETGLQCAFELHETPCGRDMALLIDAGIIQSLSPAYVYDKNINPINDISLERTIHTMHSIEEISLVMYPGFRGAMLDGTRDERETLLTEYKERMERHFKVAFKLQCEEVHEIIRKRWKEVYSAYLDGQNLIKHY